MPSWISFSTNDAKRWYRSPFCRNTTLTWGKPRLPFHLLLRPILDFRTDWFVRPTNIAKQWLTARFVEAQRWPSAAFCCNFSVCLDSSSTKYAWLLLNYSPMLKPTLHLTFLSTSAATSMVAFFTLAGVNCFFTFFIPPNESNARQSDDCALAKIPIITKMIGAQPTFDKRQD